jgi:hypothetical protein
MLPGMAEAIKPLRDMGSSISILMKGNKAVSTAGNFTTIVDFAKQEVTLIDNGHKTFATIPASQFGDSLAAAMPQLSLNQAASMKQALGSIKTTSNSKKTGRTDVIQGVQAEETELTFSMELPVPVTSAQPSTVMTMVMHVWSAKPEEASRVQAIRELTGFNLWQKYFMNPAESVRKVVGLMPGMENIASVFGEMQGKNTVMLRTHMELFMPAMAAMAAQMAALRGQPVPAIDPNAPLMQVNQEVVELSTTSLDDSVFQMPAGYAATPADDLFKAMMPLPGVPK